MDKIKNLFYRFCIWLGYIPTAHLELRAKLLGYTVYSQDEFEYDGMAGGDTTYWHIEPRLVVPRLGYALTFSSKRAALQWLLEIKGA